MAVYISPYGHKVSVVQSNLLISTYLVTLSPLRPIVPFLDRHPTSLLGRQNEGALLNIRSQASIPDTISFSPPRAVLPNLTY